MTLKSKPEIISPVLKMSELNRRRFLKALVAALAAPAIMRVFHASPAAAEDVLATPPQRLTGRPAVVFGGDILTMEGDAPSYAEAIVVSEGLITFVGSKEQALKEAGETARQIDLAGRTLMPGFVDPHLHPIQAASMLMPKYASPFDWFFPWGDAPAVRGQKDFLESVAGYSSALSDPKEPLLVWGYLLPYHGDLNRSLLDQISAERPIVIWSYSAHEFYLNSAALNHFAVPAEAFAGDPEADFGNGFFRESAALETLLPYILSIVIVRENIPLGLRRLRDVAHLGGVTTLGDMGTGSAGHLDLETGAIRAILDNDASPFRMALVPDVKTLDMLHKDDAKAVEIVNSLPANNTGRILFGKQVKLYADGAFFAEAMQLEAPGYADGHEGIWLMEPEYLDRLIKLWWSEGYDIHIHCNGSKAVTVILDSLEAAKEIHAGAGQRIVLEHFAVSQADQVDRIKKLGVSVSANPYYLYSMADAYAAGNLGPEAASQIVRLGSLAKAGVPFALHTDFTMAPLAPLGLAWIASNRITALGNEMGPEEKISVYDALKAITIGGAYVLRLEDITGSIVAGKKADFVLLAENPLKVDPLRLRDIEILGTVFEGKPYPVLAGAIDFEVGLHVDKQG